MGYHFSTEVTRHGVGGARAIVVLQLVPSNGCRAVLTHLLPLRTLEGVVVLLRE